MSKYGRFNFGSAYTEANAWPDVVAGLDQAEGELHRLRRELTGLKATLADRETALAKAALDAQLARDRWQQELSAAEKTWKAEEAAQLAAAEAQWRQQSASALAEVTARCEAAELMLEELSQEAARERNDFIGGGVSAKRANRETEFEQVISATGTERGHRTKESNIVIRTNRIWGAEAVEQRRRASRKYPILGVVAAASLGILAIAVYSSIGPLLQSRPSNFAVVTSGLSPIPGGSVVPVASSPPTSTNVPQDMAVVVREVNVRASPSNTATVVSTLQRGLKVARIEQRGSWALVQIEGADRNTRPRQGWVYGSFLKKETTRTR